MAKKCIHCGQDNDDTAFRCSCGSELPSDSGEPAPTLEPAPAALPVDPVPSAVSARGFALRKAGFVLWAAAFFGLLILLRSRLPERQVYRFLIGEGIFFAPALAAFFCLGRESRRTLLAWRIVFVVWLAILFPLIFTIVDGVAGEGWPRGRFNKPVANMLILLFFGLIPSFLAGVAALIRAMRVAAVFAILAGLGYLGTGYFIFQAGKPIKDLWRPFVTIVDVIAIWAKHTGYLFVPIGAGLIVGGILVLRGARSRTATP